MDQDAGALREELSKRLGEEKLQSLIREKEEAFHGLLSQEAAILAISKEMRVETPKKPVPLSGLSPEARRADVTAKISRIFEVKRFEKAGKEGKVCRVLLSDGKAEMPLVLWNEDVSGVEKGELAVGDAVEIRGAYLKDGELKLGYGGQISVSEKAQRKGISDLSEGDSVDMALALFDEPAYRKFEREGRQREMCYCYVDDGRAKARLVLWEPNERALEGAKRGDTVRIEAGRMKNGEIHAGKFATIRLMSKPASPGEVTAEFQGEVEGKVEKLQARGDVLCASLEGGGEAAFLLPKPLALRLLGLKSLPDDVGLETMAKLKGGGATGKKIRVFGKARPEGGKLTFLVEKLL